MRDRSRGIRPLRPVLALAGGLALSLAVVVLTVGTSGPGQLAARAGAAMQSLSQAAGLAPTARVQARGFSGTPAVGALFTTTGAGLGKHFCTASVIDSPHRDLVLTAAHCVTRIKPARTAFVPGYHGGKAPYGVWPVTRVILDPRWISSAAPDDDFAFLVVRSPVKAPVEAITGGERLGIGQPPGRMVRVVGYPDGASAPIVCSNHARLFSSDQLEFDCGGYADGTSGSPLLAGVDPATGLGTVIGVIGGYEQGGYTSDVSYAARFAGGAAALYQVAISES
jgi:V8-like Glu-specific endopeptidase